MNMQIRFNYDIDDYELFTGERWTKIYFQEDVDAMQAEIEALKDEVAEWKMSYENCHRMCSGYGMN